MDCPHFVQVTGLEVIIGGYIVFSIRPHCAWLEENKINRFRQSLWKGNKIVFRFENLEDAIAFKLRWYE